MRACWDRPRATPLRVAPGEAWGHVVCGPAAQTNPGSAGRSSRNGRLAMPFLVMVASRGASPEPRDAASPGPSTRRACAFLAFASGAGPSHGDGGPAPGPSNIGVWGFRRGNVIHVLWWDPDHTVFPGNR
jgi:hypothetical protein